MKVFVKRNTRQGFFWKAMKVIFPGLVNQETVTVHAVAVPDAAELFELRVVEAIAEIVNAY
jgi:hypothetical protein